MNSWHLALRSFKHYLSVNMAIAMGVAAATAVLTGALLIGQSMRDSLRELSLDRLGETNEMLVSQGFFNPTAINPQQSADGSLIVPAILFNNGTVETEAARNQSQRASNVNVFGIPAEFWKLDRVDRSCKTLVAESVIVNQALADELGLSTEQLDTPLTLRIPKPTQLPSESALGANRDLIESLVDLQVIQILPNEGVAGFSLHPSQLDSPNLFVPIELLQDALSRKALRHKSDSNQANVAFIAGVADSADSSSLKSFLQQSQCDIEDEGLLLKRAKQMVGEGDSQKTIFDYWSLSSEQLVLRPSLVRAIEKAFPDAQPVFTYLSNDIRKQESESGIPFSMVAALDFGESFPLLDLDGKVIEPLGADQIVLNRWAAENLEVKVGDSLVVTWYDPETTHGKQTEAEATMIVAAIAGLTEPQGPYEFERRGEVIPPLYDQAPTLANDPSLTPEVPGVTDSESIANWDLPFETASKLRPEDDSYWDYYRTTPKAFVSLAAGQRMWNSRFGNVTSFRIEGDQTREAVAERILDAIVETEGASSFTLVPLRKNLLAASSGSTPFDALFLALSMFVIASGLILVSLLFQLALQSRAAEVGTLRSVGLRAKTVSGVWLREMVLVCCCGATLGAVLGIAYAALMIWGLKTWWLGAISKPIIELHVGPLSLLAGFAGGLLICVATVLWVLRSLNRQSPKTLLSGQIHAARSTRFGKQARWRRIAAIGLLLVAIVLSVVAVGLSGDAQAGAFMGAGFCVLTALLLLVFSWLAKDDSQASLSAGLNKLSLLSLRRNPLRSTLTIGLVAVASFLIMAVSSFRLTPNEQGTAGFDYVAQSSQSIVGDLGSAEEQIELLGEPLDGVNDLYGFRFKPGEDASCNNLYQSTQARVLGVPRSFVERFDEDVQRFAWGGSIAETDAEISNPWRLLQREYDDGAIPVLIDKNTANYSLKIFAPGGDYLVQYDSGEEVTFRVVGFLSNTILQGSLLIDEDRFVEAFPRLGGARYFLIDGDPNGLPAAISILESQLGDEGFDARSAPELLKNFMSVQNTYLSTFQSLGALGLLLGTFGLAAVQIRNVFERKQELGLMRAVGFGRSRLGRMILIENVWLLGSGLAVGILAALCGTLPHFLFGDASVPWLPLLGIFAAIFLIGIVTSFLASRVLSRMELLDSLRG